MSRTSYEAPSSKNAKSQRAHSGQQEGRSSKGGSKHRLAAPPVGHAYAVRSPDGAIIPASAYNWQRGDILVPAQGAA